MLIKLFHFAFCAFLYLCKPKLCTGDGEAPIVSVKQGQIQGINSTSVNGKQFFSFFGIPYAKSPEGKLRFKDPVPAKSWDGVRNGGIAPVSCLQSFLYPLNYIDGELAFIAGTEDCLYLNVFTSAPNKPDMKLPVMVFIHGGGFTGGNANFQPNVLLNEDIVLVTLQYRLGVFGFLSTGDSVMAGNMGLKDQQLALKWIRKNIKRFGGDPKTVTIFGISAGGASVHYQVLSPGSKGLFKRAIIQSGTALSPWASNKNHRKFAIETGREFNCSLDFGSEMYLECMQNVYPYYLQIAGAKTNLWGFYPVYVLPRVDGEFLPEPPEVLMKNGKYNKVDIISGVIRDDGGIDLVFDYFIPKRRLYFNQDFDKFGPISLFFKDEENSLNLTKQVYQYYLKRDNFTVTEDDWRAIVDMNTDRMFHVDHDIVANFFAADPDVKLYTYQLDQLSKAASLTDTQLITHGEDLLYLSYEGKLQDENDLKVREIFTQLWTNFAREGNPTPLGSNFTWEEATSESFKHLSLTTTPMMKEDTYQTQREFWSSLKTYQNKLLSNI